MAEARMANINLMLMGVSPWDSVRDGLEGDNVCQDTVAYINPVHRG